MIHRYLEQILAEDLKEKMVFIGGPRQVGKTTFAKALAGHRNISYQYLNWDDRRDRKKIVNYDFDQNAKLLFFDEIHKWKNWKNYLKGVYDTEKERYHILVTGSARLDRYRRGGDSLLGRYHYHLLHPLSLAELLRITPSVKAGKELVFKSSFEAKKIFKALFQFGGFPEPFLKHDEIFLKRWHDERMDRLIKDDIREIESIRDLSALQILVDLLPDRAGRLLSLNNLRADLEVAHKTIRFWMDILERFYYCFRISPYQGKLIRSLKKEKKLYLWDWSEIEGPGIRFENMVASHLFKFCNFLRYRLGEKAELFFLRDRDQREVDFLVTLNRKPWFAVEAKLSDREPSRALSYFGERLKIPFLYQVVLETEEDIWNAREQVRVISAKKFLSGLV